MVLRAATQQILFMMMTLQIDLGSGEFSPSKVNAAMRLFLRNGAQNSLLGFKRKKRPGHVSQGPAGTHMHVGTFGS